jgi:hypothetical protein
VGFDAALNRSSSLLDNYTRHFGIYRLDVTAPIINLMNSHIRAEAKRVGAKVVDLYHSDIEPNDIVFGIEPGPTASPKIAQAIVKAMRVS